MNFSDMWVTDEDGRRFVFTVEMQRQLSEAGLPVEPASLSELGEMAPAGSPSDEAASPQRERDPQRSRSSKEKSEIEEPATIQIDPESGKYLGRLKWYNPTRGYGFIARGGGEDIFFHKSDVSVDPETLEDGQWILYDVEETNKGLEASEIDVYEGSMEL